MGLRSPSPRLSTLGAALLLLGQQGCLYQPPSPASAPSQQAFAPAQLAGVPVSAPATPGLTGPVSFAAGLESSHVLAGSDGQAFLVIDLGAEGLTGGPRAPVAVALVLDRSGSMSGDKMEQARLAATSLIGSLADGDVVALYAFDDVVEQLAPPTVLSAATRPALLAAPGQLYARGSTNLQGGLIAGVQALTTALAERPLRRVILVSDGNANVGPSSPGELGASAALAAAQGISVTSIGVGLDYNEALLDAVAIRSGGRFYHLGRPGELASLLLGELDRLGATVASGVQLLLEPAPGVEVTLADGADLIRRGPLVQLNLGDLIDRQRRQVVLPLRVPTAGPVSARALGQLTLSYRSTSTGAEVTERTSLGYQLSATAAAVEENVRPELAAAVEQHRASQAQLRAAELSGQGRVDAAADLLAAQAASSARRARALGGQAGERIRQNVSELEARSGQVRSSRSGSALRGQQLELNQAALRGSGY